MDTVKRAGRPRKPSYKKRTSFTLSVEGNRLLSELAREYGLEASQMLEVIIRDRYEARQRFLLEVENLKDKKAEREEE